MLRILFVISVLAGGADFAQAMDYAWDLVPITPECQSGYFCTKEEMPQEVKDAGIVARLVDLAERAYKADATFAMAFMSFTEPTLFQPLCDLAKRGLKIEGFFAANAGPPRGLGFRLESECRAGRRRNVVMHYMGMPKSGKSGWRLHHNKFVAVEFPDGRAELAFGSANLSTHGLSVNFENWNFVIGRRDQTMIAEHFCNLQAMRAARAAAQKEDDPKVFRAQLERCLAYKDLSPAEFEKLLVNEGVAVLFAPDPKDQVFEVLANNIRRVVDGGKIQMAVYFFMHRPIVDELKAAHARGVKIEILVDDDIFLGNSIPTQKRFWEEQLKPEVSGFTVRMFDTNEAIFQLQHHKFMVLSGVDAKGKVRVFTGAGQFTLSAFSNNYENFYLIDDKRLADAYKDLFQELWTRAAVVKAPAN